jgi:hypothetical protein
LFGKLSAAGHEPKVANALATFSRVDSDNDSDKRDGRAWTRMDAPTL